MSTSSVHLISDLDDHASDALVDFVIPSIGNKIVALLGGSFEVTSDYVSQVDVKFPESMLVLIGAGVEQGKLYWRFKPLQVGDCQVVITSSNPPGITTIWQRYIEVKTIQAPPTAATENGATPSSRIHARRESASSRMSPGRKR